MHWLRALKQKKSCALELVGLQILYKYLLLWLNLQQFEQEADELRWPLVAVDSAYALELDGLVNQGLRWRISVLE